MTTKKSVKKTVIKKPKKLTIAEEKAKKLQTIQADKLGLYGGKKSKFPGTVIKDLSTVKDTYDIIYCDPPWRYNDKLDLQGEGAATHYNVMTINDLKKMPINDIGKKDSIMFMWVTMPLMQEGLDLMKAWGYEYRTCFNCWIKLNPKAKTVFKGIGRWVMGNAELCLLGKKGKPQREVKHVHQVVCADRGKHSQKPEETRERIVELMGDKKRIELFARNITPGWDVFGNEV